MKSTTLDIVFGVAQDTTVHPDQRRKAASEIAQHFLPMKVGIRRWWENAPADEYGFAIRPQIAEEYRDIRLELRRWRRSRANGSVTERKAAKIRERLKSILNRLQCPCPSRYGRDQLAEDSHRLFYFARQRDNKIILNEKENAEEAHRRARVDCFDEGPESAARQRLSILKDKERRFTNASGPALTWKEQIDLRFLRLLYPQQGAFISGPDHHLCYQPLRDEPLALDGNLYPRYSKLAPPKETEIVEELFDVPSYVAGNSSHLGHRWSGEPET